MNELSYLRAFFYSSNHNGQVKNSKFLLFRLFKNSVQFFYISLTKFFLWNLFHST
jgi:hypothetical protein